MKFRSPMFTRTGLTGSGTANGIKRMWPNELTKMAFLATIGFGLILFGNRASKILATTEDAAYTFCLALFMLPVSLLILDVFVQIMRSGYRMATAGKRYRKAEQARRDQQLEEALEKIRALEAERGGKKIRPLRQLDEAESGLDNPGSDDALFDLGESFEERTETPKAPGKK